MVHVERDRPDDGVSGENVIHQRRPKRQTSVINLQGIPVIIPTNNEDDGDGGAITAAEKNESNRLKFQHGCRSNTSTTEKPISREKTIRLERSKWKRRSSDNGSYPVLSHHHQNDYEIVDGGETVSNDGMIAKHDESIACTIQTGSWGWTKTSLSIVAIVVAVSLLMPSSTVDNAGRRGSSTMASPQKMKVFKGDDDQYPIEHTILAPRSVRPVRPATLLQAGNKIPTQRTNSADRETIINGSDVMNSQDEYPYVVSLLKRDWRRQQAWHTCGGALITPNIILTAAHCYYAIDIAHIGPSSAAHKRRRNLKVDDNALVEESLKNDEIDQKDHEEQEGIILNLPGSTDKKRSLVNINNLENNDSFGKAYNLRYWDKIKHPKFDSNTGEFDIMIVKLPAWNEGVRTIRINDNPLLPRNGVVNDQATVLGWGVTQKSNSNSLSEILQRASLQTEANLVCGQKYEQLFGFPIIQDNMLCAHSDDGQDACRGDSGGPLIKEHPDDPSKDSVLGLVSWGEECGHEHYPGVYSRVSASHNWITDTVCNVLSPESCSSGKIKEDFSTQDNLCEDYVGILPTSSYRTCSWVNRMRWIGCFLHKDVCPVTCNVKDCTR